MNVLVIRRGDIYFADLRPVVGSEQGGIRPVLIIQNDMGNRHSPTVICAAITSKMNKAKLPTHIALEVNKYDIIKDSVMPEKHCRTCLINPAYALRLRRLNTLQQGTTHL